MKSSTGNVAKEILRGTWLPDRPFYQDPLIHYLLAGLMAVVGSGTAPLRIALACLGALTPIITYWVGLRILGRAEAILAGLALALYGPLVFTDAQLEKEGFAALISALGFLATVHAAEPTRRGIIAFIAGLLWGGMTLLRGNALLVAPIGAIWWLYCSQLPRLQRWLRAIAFTVGFATVLAPVSLVNVAVSQSHEFILTTWQSGAMFYTGNGPNVSGVGEPSFIRRDPHLEAQDFAAEAESPNRPATLSRRGLFFLDARGPTSLARSSCYLARFPHVQVRFVVERPGGSRQSKPGLGSTGSNARLKRCLPELWLACSLARTWPAKNHPDSLVFVSYGHHDGGALVNSVVPCSRTLSSSLAPGLALLAAAGIVDLGRQLRKRQWSSIIWRVLAYLPTDDSSYLASRH